MQLLQMSHYLDALKCELLGEDVPVFLCGDFNNSSDSKLYKFLRDGSSNLFDPSADGNSEFNLWYQEALHGISFSVINSLRSKAYIAEGRKVNSLRQIIRTVGKVELVMVLLMYRRHRLYLVFTFVTHSHWTLAAVFGRSISTMVCIAESFALVRPYFPLGRLLLLVMIR